MPRLKLVIAYVGTNYCGWQIQAYRDRPRPPTIQDCLAEALSEICACEIKVQGSSRTDSGVHAEYQVAHCDVPDERAGIDWQIALHTRLPHEIRIVDAQIVAADFDAGLALRKAYIYRLWLDQHYCPPWLHPYVWACGPLDLERLDLAIPYLLGEHDFKSLQNSGTKLKTTTRNLLVLRREQAEEEGRLLKLYFESNGFLKQMVRNLTGLLVACGRGKFNPRDIPDLLAARDRRLAPLTAPAKGLTLHKIWF